MVLNKSTKAVHQGYTLSYFGSSREALFAHLFETHLAPYGQLNWPLALLIKIWKHLWLYGVQTYLGDLSV